MEDEIKAIADIIAESNFDTHGNNAVLTAHGYENRNVLKDALKKIDSEDWNDSLKKMAEDGAEVYKAVCHGEIVGVIILVCLPRLFTIPKPLDKVQGSDHPAGDVPIPELSDLNVVKDYAICKERDKAFSIELREKLNCELTHYGAGKVWGEHRTLSFSLQVKAHNVLLELSGLGVTERFRRQGIGKNLVQHALSRVPRGHTAVLLAERNKDVMYKNLGFDWSPRVGPIVLSPKWAERELLSFELMVHERE
jgi:GNAT superfamily N-acetyltransferase